MVAMKPVFALVLASAPLLASGHAYVWWPTSREAINPSPRGPFSFNKPMYSELHQSQHGKGQGGAGNAKTPGSYSKFLCNGIAQGPSVKEYEEGGEMRVVIPVNGEHGGEYDFRMCTKPWASLGSDVDKAKCLDEYLIHRNCVESPCSCKSDHCRMAKNVDQSSDIYERARAEGADKTPMHKDASIQGGHEVVFNLPSGVSCEKCTVQWFWHTAWGEEFAGCMDITIKSAGGGEDGGAGGRSGKGNDGRPGKGGESDGRRRGGGGKGGSGKGGKGDSRRRGGKGGGRRRRKNNVAAAGAYHEDISSQSLGCYAKAENDNYAPISEVRDEFCFETPAPHFGPSAPCRSGLPFFRTTVGGSGNAVKECFKFCNAKGLDLFGLTEGRSECRCGASLENEDVWGDNEEDAKKRGLLLTQDRIGSGDGCEGVEVFQYTEWKQKKEASGTGDLLKGRDSDDIKYMDRIIKGE